MFEYVRVIFEDQRDVFIAGKKMGRTNRKFRIGGGTYTFDLGEPKDYSPQRQKALVEDTTEDTPLEVHFAKV